MMNSSRSLKTNRQIDKEKRSGKISFRLRKQLEKEGSAEVKDFLEEENKNRTRKVQDDIQ